MESVCVSSLVYSLFDSKDLDYLYFVHITLLLWSSLEQTEQTVGIPGKKLREAHPEIKACSIITAWLEAMGWSPRVHSRTGRVILVKSLSEFYLC